MIQVLKVVLVELLHSAYGLDSQTYLLAIYKGWMKSTGYTAVT